MGERLRKLREARGLTQGQVAEAVGMSQKTVSSIETGRTRFPQNLDELVRFFGCTYGDLMGEGPNTAAATAARRVLPVLSYVEAAEWPSQQRDVGTMERRTIYAADGAVGPRAFALVVQGDSMVAPHGVVTYPPGCTVVVDPDLPPQPGKRVVYKLPGESAATLRQLEFDGSKQWLKPLNLQYPTIPLPPEATYIGQVVQAIIDET